MKQHGKFVSDLRVSTKRQGESGLRLEAQRKAVADYLNGGRWKLVAEFIETESGKDDRNRPELQRALDACKVYGATFVIAKLDRLSRNAHFLTGLHEAGVKFVAVDMPEANEMVVMIMATVAQAERWMISERTKAALQAAKARGMRLGNHRVTGIRRMRRLGSRGCGPGGEGAGICVALASGHGRFERPFANAAAAELNRRA